MQAVTQEGRFGWRTRLRVWHAECVRAHATVQAGSSAEREGLATAFRRGDPQAIEAAYDQHASGLLGLALRMLGDRSEAEDLVHDVFVEAWRNRARFDPKRGSLGAWLAVRLRSRAIDRLRRRRADPVRAIDSTGGAGSPTDPADDRPIDGLSRSVDQRRACDALASLTDAQRSVVELAYFGGLTFREIGEHLGIPVTTAKSRLVAAIRVLRQRLGADEVP